MRSVTVPLNTLLHLTCEANGFAHASGVRYVLVTGNCLLVSVYLITSRFIKHLPNNKNHFGANPPEVIPDL